MNFHDRRIQRKRNKAQRNLEKMLDYYSHNNVVLQLQITSYLRTFCRNKYGEIHPDIYIESYITKVENKMRKVAE
ncbi:hypothetical protein LCGC14_1536550 [marine sediment metagenome]|uniref:Uncharacterized protein n=1 Tax=marine sediment metagenome TaxID=412755 RepID=A0A0F9IUC5_9ZZZZ